MDQSKEPKLPTLPRREVNLTTGGTEIITRVPTNHGKVTTLAIRRSDFSNSKKLHEQLINADSTIPLRYVEAQKYLLTLQKREEKIEDNRSVIDQCGWFEGSYITQQSSLGSSNAIQLSTKSFKQGSGAFGMVAGSIAGYHLATTALLEFSDEACLVVCAQAASILAGRVDIGEPAIFHIFGRSGLGKTVLVRLGMSFVGRAKREDVPTHDVTEVGFQDYCTTFRHSLTIMDEIATKTEHPRTALNRLMRTAHVFVSRRSRTYSTAYREQTRRDPTTWSQMGLSTGELSLQEIAAKACQEVEAGVLRRFIDIPLTDHILDNAGDDIDDTSEFRNALMDCITIALSQNYGVALAALVDHVNATDEIGDEFEWHRREFNAQFSGGDGWSVAFVDKFAVCYAAGVISIDAGVLRITPQRLLLAVKAICQKAKHYCTGQEVEDQRAIQKLKTILADDDAFPLVESFTVGSISPSAIGFRRKTPSGRPYAVVRREELQKIAGSSTALNSLLQRLKQEGLLFMGSDGKTSQPVVWPGSAKQVRCFRIWVNNEPQATTPSEESY